MWSCQLHTSNETPGPAPPTRTYTSLQCLDQDIDIGVEMYSLDFSLVLLDQEAKQGKNKMPELDNELII